MLKKRYSKKQLALAKIGAPCCFVMPPLVAGERSIGADQPLAGLVARRRDIAEYFISFTSLVRPREVVRSYKPRSSAHAVPIAAT